MVDGDQRHNGTKAPQQELLIESMAGVINLRGRGEGVSVNAGIVKALQKQVMNEVQASRQHFDLAGNIELTVSSQ